MLLFIVPRDIAGNRQRNCFTAEHGFGDLRKESVREGMAVNESRKTGKKKEERKWKFF